MIAQKYSFKQNLFAFILSLLQTKKEEHSHTRNLLVYLWRLVII